MAPASGTKGGRLTVRGCRFERNEIGLLTWNSPAAELDVESSAFRDNVVTQEPLDIDPGHQIYVGSIARFSLRGSHVSHGANGHLVKSRARENHIFYNRLTDEAGFASYELEFPSGGIAYVVGNLIEQSARTRNEVMISFGAEGYRWPRNDLYLAYNTLVDHYPGGQFLRVLPGAQRALAVNNLLVGPGSLDVAGSGNVRVTSAAFAAPAVYDFRLRRGRTPVGRVRPPGSGGGRGPRPRPRVRASARDPAAAEPAVEARSDANPRAVRGPCPDAPREPPDPDRIDAASPSRSKRRTVA